MLNNSIQNEERVTVDTANNALNYIYDEYHKSFNEISSKYPWPKKMDFRLEHLEICGENILQHLLSSMFLTDQLTQPEWWMKKYKNIDQAILPQLIESKLSRYDQQLRANTFNSSLLTFEWFVVVIYFKLMNKPITTIQKNIDEIIIAVLDQLSLYSEYQQLIKIIYHLKDAYFYGGFFYKKDEDIYYKGKEFLFTNGFLIPAEYTSWESITFLLVEMLNLYVAILTSKMISSYDRFISPHFNIEVTTNPLATLARVDDVKKTISFLKKQNLENLKDEAIVDEFHRLGFIPYLTTTLNQGKFIYRARPSESSIFSKATDLSYVPKECNKAYGRASTPKNTMFYGSINIDNNKGLKTLSEEIVILTESSKLFRESTLHNDGIERITIGKWEVINQIPLISIVYHRAYARKNSILKEQQKIYYRFIRQFPIIKEQIIEVTDFIAGEFAKKIDNNYEYKISALFTEHVGKVAKNSGHEVAGILYPSKQTEGDGLCVAIHPDWVNSCLKLVEVLEVKLYKKDKKIVVNNIREAIVEKSSDSFKLKKIIDPRYCRSDEQINIMLNSSD